MTFARSGGKVFVRRINAYSKKLFVP